MTRIFGGTYNGRNEARKMFESPCWKKAEAKLWMKAEMKFISWKMAEINQGSNLYDYRTQNTLFVLSMSKEILNPWKYISFWGGKQTSI